MDRLFRNFTFGEGEWSALDRDGHVVLPGILTIETCERLTAALGKIRGMVEVDEEYPPRRFAAEFDAYLASLIGHPQLLELVRRVLGDSLRFDHCVALNRKGGDGGTSWHSHEYGDDDLQLGFVRVFFYVNGLAEDDGGLKVVRGSHHYRDAGISGASDAELESGWMAGKRHASTGQPLRIEGLSAPAGTVVLMWTHAAHGVTPCKPESGMRWCVVYAYRNPGEPSAARWLSAGFEKSGIAGTEGLMSLY